MPKTVPDIVFDELISHQKFSRSYSSGLDYDDGDDEYYNNLMLGYYHDQAQRHKEIKEIVKNSKPAEEKSEFNGDDGYPIYTRVEAFNDERQEMVLGTILARKFIDNLYWEYRIEADDRNIPSFESATLVLHKSS
jgi:hypothetical protein